jgi:hypothetical protein
MKQLLIKTFVTSLFIPFYSFAQSDVQIDIMKIFARTKSLQTATISNMNIQATKNLSIPLCNQTIKYYPIPKQESFTNIHPDVGIYSNEYPSNIFTDGYKNQDSFAPVNADAGETCRLIPYNFYQFLKPEVINYFEPSQQYKLVNVFNVSSGIMFNGTVANNVLSNMRKPDPLTSKNDYQDKSKRQKTTGMVLLITGMTLLTTSVVIGSHQDGITGVGTVFYVGGPGIILSLASIPFFVSSAHNKSKWMNYK